MANNSLNKNLPLIFIIGLLFSGLMSCKKEQTDDDTVAPVNTPTGTLMFHLHTYIENDEVDLYNIVYSTEAGRNMSLSLAQLYISDIQLIKPDGSVYNVAGKNVLKVFESETSMIGDVPVGNYKSIRFKVGLSATTNQSDPSASADELILNRPEMWFGSAAQPDGYVFMNVQGMIDTTAAMTGALVPFEYKIGTNANYKQVILPENNFTIAEGQVGYAHLMVDYYKLFEGIDISQNANLFVETPLDNSSEIGQAIANNIPSMFSYEE